MHKDYNFGIIIGKRKKVGLWPITNSMTTGYDHNDQSQRMKVTLSEIKQCSILKNFCTNKTNWFKKQNKQTNPSITYNRLHT